MKVGDWGAGVVGQIEVLCGSVETMEGGEGGRGRG